MFVSTVSRSHRHRHRHGPQSTPCRQSDEHLDWKRPWGPMMDCRSMIPCARKRRRATIRSEKDRPDEMTRPDDTRAAHR